MQGILILRFKIFRMNTKNSILFAIGIVVANILIGHFFAPYGIMLTPIVLILLSILIGLVITELQPILKSILLAGLIIIHDVGIKLYAGGTHDLTGIGWIVLMMFIGLVPAYIFLIGGIFKSEDESKLNKWIAVFIFPLLLGIHLKMFWFLGLTQYP